jgi:hypothetical protein
MLINENGISVRYENGKQTSTAVENLRVAEKTSQEIMVNKFKL